MKQFDLQGNEYDCTIEIPLKKATYEDIQALNIDLQTKLFVKDKEIERLNKELKSLQDSYDIEEEQANYHIDLTDDLREEVDRLNNIIEEALKLNRDLQEHLDKEFWIGRLELQEQILKGSDKE